MSCSLEGEPGVTIIAAEGERRCDYARRRACKAFLVTPFASQKGFLITPLCLPKGVTRIIVMPRGG